MYAGSTPSRFDATIRSASGQTVAHEDSANIMSLGSEIRPRNCFSFVMALRRITGMEEWQVR